MLVQGEGLACCLPVILGAADRLNSNPLWLQSSSSDSPSLPAKQISLTPNDISLAIRYSTEAANRATRREIDLPAREIDLPVATERFQIAEEART
jgi:hypothetical protein